MSSQRLPLISCNRHAVKRRCSVDDKKDAKRIKTQPGFKFSAYHLDIMQLHYSHYYVEPKEKSIKDMDIDEFVPYLDLRPAGFDAGNERRPREKRREFFEYFDKTDACGWPFSSELGAISNRKIPGCTFNRDARTQSQLAYETMVAAAMQIGANYDQDS